MTRTKPKRKISMTRPKADIDAYANRLRRGELTCKATKHQYDDEEHLAEVERLLLREKERIIVGFDYKSTRYNDEGEEIKALPPSEVLVQTVIDMILMCKPKWHIHRWMNQEFGIARPVSRTIYRIAAQTIEATCSDRSIEEARAEAVEGLRFELKNAYEIYELAVAKGFELEDRRKLIASIHRIRMDLAQLQGVNIHKFEVKGHINLRGMSDEDLEKMEAEMAQEIAGELGSHSEN